MPIDSEIYPNIRNRNVCVVEGVGGNGNKYFKIEEYSRKNILIYFTLLCTRKCLKLFDSETCSCFNIQKVQSIASDLSPDCLALSLLSRGPVFSVFWGILLLQVKSYILFPFLTQMVAYYTPFFWPLFFYLKCHQHGSPSWPDHFDFICFSKNYITSISLSFYIIAIIILFWWLFSFVRWLATI